MTDAVATLVDKGLKGAGLLKRVEILALNVFSQADLDQLGVGVVGDIAWHHIKAGQLCGAQPALAVDQLEGARERGVWPDAQTAGEALLPDRLGQLLDIGEAGAGLEWVGLDQI